MVRICMHTLHGIHMLIMLTHDSMYAHIYTCTHCGRKGHLAKFCYYGINDSNFVNKLVWVRKGTNPHGPNIVWVPKFTPIVFDIGVGSNLMWGYRYLDGECVWAWWILHWMHHLQGCLLYTSDAADDLLCVDLGGRRIIKNDICVLKKSVDCLGSTLSQYAMDHKRLESMFRKKHAPHIHAHHSRHTHAHHAHTWLYVC